MYKQEKINPYGKKGDKDVLVREMFNNIAPTYDRLNHLMSFDIDKGWRKKAVRQLLPYEHNHILDIATGTRRLRHPSLADFKSGEDYRRRHFRGYDECGQAQS